MPREIPRVTRRQIFLCVLLPLTACAPDPGGAEDGERTLAFWLRRLPPGPVAAAGIGLLYLRNRPEEQAAGWLAATLFNTELSRKLDRAGFHDLLQRLIADRTRDFLSDDLVILDGWAIPRTEARLLALIALCGDA